MDAIGPRRLILPTLALLWVLLLGSWAGALLYLARDGLDATGPLPFVFTSEPTSTAIPTGTLAPMVQRTTGTVQLSIGPGSQFALIGSLPRDAIVQPIEKDSSGQWLAITFPPNSTSKAWLPASMVTIRPANETALNPETTPLVPTPAAIAPEPARGTLDKPELQRIGAVAAAGLPIIGFGLALIWVSSRKQRAEPEESPDIEPAPKGPALAIAPARLPTYQGAAEIEAFTQAFAKEMATAFAASAESQRLMFERQLALLAQSQDAATTARQQADRAAAAAAVVEEDRTFYRDALVRLQEERSGLNQLITDLRLRIGALSRLAEPYQPARPPTVEEPKEPTLIG